MGVEAGVRDLERSYAGHRDSAADLPGASARLLRFYSVECGLKAAILGKRGINARGTGDLPSKLRSHDLRDLAKALRLPAAIAGGLNTCRRKHDAELHVHPHELHEAWRYGAELHAGDEKAADAALSDLSEWCRKELSR